MSTTTAQIPSATKNSNHHAQYGPKLVTPLPGPNAQRIVADDDRLISPSYTRSYPMVAKRGRGVRKREDTVQGGP